MTHSSLPLGGRTAIVTGSSRNIGRAIALALAADGACVVINARNDEEGADAVVAEIEAAGGRAIKHMADVTDEAAVDGLAQAAIDAFGGINILVNNAAVRRQQSLESMSLAEWRAITAIILDAAFLCARACLPHMVAAGGGAIVNIGGISAHFGAVDRPHVIAAKAGVIGLTKAIAVDYAGRNIRANCVVPGTMDTTRGEDAHPVAPHPGGHKALIDRLGTPGELAAAVRYLCGPDAGYITGQTLHVNGGMYLGG
ncbi:MAG: SDR family oxidoreductase [Proteobacteria bacterium]|nr:SDR family oxidoreductase [Pseudomonadota bacterium]